MSALPNVINAAFNHPVLMAELITTTDSLVNNVREALLEARDDTDVGWIRARSIRELNNLFSQVKVMKDEFVLLKLNVLEQIERESIVGHANAVKRSNKWRKALVERYFGS